MAFYYYFRGWRIGERGGREEMQEIREEVEKVLNKDRRREDRRVTRQDNKRSHMVRLFLDSTRVFEAGFCGKL